MRPRLKAPPHSIKTAIEQKRPREGVLITRDGQRIVNVHRPEECEAGGPCCIHSPSDHKMRTWPTRWRAGYRTRRGVLLPLMYRVCAHDEVHYDPDSAAWLRPIMLSDMGVVLSDCIQRCDGCCR